MHGYVMGRISKRKSLYKNQERDKNGLFVKKNTEEIEEDNDENNENNIDDNWFVKENERFQRLQKLDLTWKNKVDKSIGKRDLYMTGKLPKSTYYDKYGPNGSFTKAAKGTAKITSFWNNPAQVIDDLDDLEEEDIWETEVFNKKRENLKKELINPLTIKSGQFLNI